VRIADREGFEGNAALEELIAAESQALEGRGRILVRASGTEPLIRVMVEAPTADETSEVCQRLAVAVADELGTA
jgi:phosphoglucosamine mutase